VNVGVMVDTDVETEYSRPVKIGEHQGIRVFSLQIYMAKKDSGKINMGKIWRIVVKYQMGYPVKICKDWGET
jgi:hypothetical protein